MATEPHEPLYGETGLSHRSIKVSIFVGRFRQPKPPPPTHNPITHRNHRNSKHQRTRIIHIRRRHGYQSRESHEREHVKNIHNGKQVHGGTPSSEVEWAQLWRTPAESAEQQESGGDTVADV